MKVAQSGGKQRNVNLIKIDFRRLVRFCVGEMQINRPQVMQKPSARSACLQMGCHLRDKPWRAARAFFHFKTRQHLPAVDDSEVG
jgi:hypothetical protein